jgi:cytochrome c6
MAITALVFGTVGISKGQETKGEELFKRYCAICHHDGGNTVNPQKTLSKKDRESNGVNTTGDIVAKIRNPGPGMAKYDEKTVTDKDAYEIAEYILNTFK